MNNFPRFVQISTLTTYSASLLNRDDSGLAKRIPFGDSVRTRISSQCLKRHWRNAGGPYGLDKAGDALSLSVRSRFSFPELIEKPLVAEGLEQKLVVSGSQKLQQLLYNGEEKGDTKKDKKKKIELDEDGYSAKRNELVVLGRPELEYLKQIIRDAISSSSNIKEIDNAVKDFYTKRKSNLLALRAGCGVDAAMFGRFVSGDVDAKVTAAVHVAHSFTIHGEQSETDYFTAVDDLVEQGTGHINAAELNTGIYYGYVVVDVPQLISNLCGCDPKNSADADRTLAAQVTSNLIHLMATVTPGAKLSGTAPYAASWLVLAEWGNSQPRTLADAFFEGLKLGSDGSARSLAVQLLAEYIQKYDAMYTPQLIRRCASIEPCQIPGAENGSLDELCEAVKLAIEGA